MLFRNRYFRSIAIWRCLHYQCWWFLWSEFIINSSKLMILWWMYDFMMKIWFQALLFSYETQTTIGYGGRGPTERCPSTVFVVMVQSVLSTLIDAFAIGWIIAKISRPKRRAEVKIGLNNSPWSNHRSFKNFFRRFYSHAMLLSICVTVNSVWWLGLGI